jgi:hypothetical protein
MFSGRFGFYRGEISRKAGAATMTDFFPRWRTATNDQQFIPAR